MVVVLEKSAGRRGERGTGVEVLDSLLREESQTVASPSNQSVSNLPK